MKKHLLETIKDLRNNKRLKLREISEIVGYSGSYISQLLRKDPNYNPYLYYNLQKKQLSPNTAKKFEQIKHLRYNKKLTFTEIGEILNISTIYANWLIKKDPLYKSQRLQSEFAKKNIKSRNLEIMTRNQNIKIDKKNGLTPTQLVEKYKLHKETIHKILRNTKN